MKERIYIASGIVSVGLGVVGIFLPLLPTTPFLLVALWCFTHGSQKWKQWLLSNRFFGKTLDNYHHGRGVPLWLKLYSLLLLWATIGFSVVWGTDLLWLRIVLLFIALAVTTHVFHIKTLHAGGGIVLLVPTAMEFEHIKELKGVRIVICGVGVVEVAVVVDRVLREKRQPDMMILAGIAGAYKGAGPAIGDTVMVKSERSADLGAFCEGHFLPLFTSTYICPYRSRSIESVDSNSVSVAGAPFLDIYSGESGHSSQKAAIENMEGAAFFALCQGAGVDFCEIRSVSNFVGDRKELWNIDLACTNLAVGLKTLIDEINS